jgi:hypothetical protein
MSDAPVRIESEVWDDWRFQALADELGIDLYSAVGRMARLWGQCTDKQSPILPVGAVRARLGQRGVDALCDVADLGERVDGGVRLRGTEGRIEWLGAARAQRALAGEARARKASRDSGGRFAAGPAGQRHAGGIVSTTAEHRAEPSDCIPAHDSASDAPRLGPAATPAAPASNQLSSLLSPVSTQRTNTTGVGQRRALALAVWQEHQAARSSVAEALGIADVKLPAMDRGLEELAMRVRDHSVDGLEEAAERCRRVLERVKSECLRDRTIDYLDGQLWRQDRFDRAYAKSASPLRTAQPPQKRGVGRAEPHAPSEYPDGEVVL